MEPEHSVISDTSEREAPATRREFRLRDLYFSPALAVRAILALFKARLALRRLSGFDLVVLNCEFDEVALPNASDLARAEAYRDRVAVAIRYLARFVPWRSDCVVQALAARNMLKSRGIPSEIRVGAKPSPESGVDAHAWLVSNGRVITGAHSQDYPLFVGAGDTPRKDSTTASVKSD